MGRTVSERQSHPEIQEPRFQPGVQEFQDMFRTLQAGRLCFVDVEKKVSIPPYLYTILYYKLLLLLLSSSSSLTLHVNCRWLYDG